MNKERAGNKQDVAAGERRVDRGLDFAMKVNKEADQRNTAVFGAQGKAANAQRGIMDQSGQALGANMANYDASRGAILGNASQLEQLANNAPANYMKTDQAAFAAQQDAGARQAMAISAQGGAGGLRSALATNAASGAQAQQQANITRANEYNQLLGMQQSGIASASNIRSGLAAQDQSAAGLYAGREQAAAGQQGSLMRDQAGTAQNDAAIGMEAATLRTNTGLGQQTANLDSRANMENSQLNAGRESEKQRLDKQKDTFDRWIKPFGG